MTLFQRQQSEDPDLQKAQENLENSSRIPFSSAIVRGALVKDVDIITNGTVIVKTTLGRPWQGFIIVNQVQDINDVDYVVNDTTKKVNNKKVIALKGVGSAIGRAKFSFWFF